MKRRKGTLMAVHQDLQLQEKQAARNLKEGMEKTLTLHRLGLAKELGRSLRTTNIIEILNSRLGERLRKIKCWVNSDQHHR